MTVVYFVRHAQSDNSVSDGMIRPLTEKGMYDRTLVTAFLSDKQIDAAFSSPFKRAVDTIADFTEKNGLPIEIVDDFKEHQTISDTYADCAYFPFIERYWADMEYKVAGDESLADVQRRNIGALQVILAKHKDKNIIIGTHGIALSTILNYYDHSYSYENFLAMVKIKPWIVKMEFKGDACVHIEYIDPSLIKAESFAF